MGKVVVQGIQYDAKSSFLRGPRLAPPLIRKAYHSDSANYFAENGSNISPDVLQDTGNYEIKDYFDITAITAKNLQDDKPLLTLGGDHSITYPIMQAFHTKFGKVDILHIDAHGDLYDSFGDDPYSHALFITL